MPSHKVHVMSPMQPFQDHSDIPMCSVASWRSASEFSTEITQVQKEITQGSWKRKAVDVIKLAVIILLQLVALVVVCTLALNQAGSIWQDSDDLQQHIIHINPIRDLLTKLQAERGMNCLFLSSDSTKQAQVSETLATVRGHTDNTMSNIKLWLGTTQDGKEADTKQHFDTALNIQRIRVRNHTVDCYQNLVWYTSKVDIFLAQIQRRFLQVSDGNIWNLVSSEMTLLKTKDLVGIKRALGGSYFLAEVFGRQKMQEFQYISGGAKYLFSASVMAYPKSGILYDSLASGETELINELWELESIINLNNRSSERSPTQALAWFHNMTDYTALMTQVEDMTAKTLTANLQKKVDESVYIYITALTCVILTLIMCPPLLTWYGMEARKMQKQIAKFTKDMALKSKELKFEKQKSDMLLYQMLPMSIVNDMRQNNPVTPENFQEVTVYFSDIVGFTTLSGKSTPIQIIELLNKLYTNCDTILDKYDVYKVETIGDAYMVVSGLPKRNGKRHTDQICTMALDILQMIELFEIPHMPSEHLLIRIGIHSGPCAAGIVGTKMPRYCLFGDTVNIASRMESSGAAMRIHVSPSTKYNLETFFQEFEFVSHGEIYIKGKGEMTTFWLLGKENFPYKINLEETIDKLNAATYWCTSN